MLEATIWEQVAQSEAAVAPDVRKSTVASIRELEARVGQGKIRERVYAEIERLQRRSLLREAMKSTGIMLITRRKTEVLREAISDPLSEEFARLIAALNLTHLPISVDASQRQKGRALHGLTLGMQDGTKVPADEVLSEGEHRCTAIAAFFAEIQL